MTLRFKGYRAPRSDENIQSGNTPPASSSVPPIKKNPEDQFQIFEFSVPLPAPSRSASLLYSRANNAPCQRGQQGREAGVEPTDMWEAAHHLLSLGLEERKWSSYAHPGTQIYDSSTKSFSNASNSVRERWNARVDKLLPPWLSLEERSQDEVNLDDQVKVRAEETLEQNLQIFLDDKSGSKWLICPQTVYGWDLSLIRDQVKSLIPDETASNESQQPASISYVSVSVDPLPAFMAIAVASRLALASRSVLGEGMTSMFWFSFGIALLLCYNAAVLALWSSAQEHFLTSIWMICLIDLCLGAFTYLGFLCMNFTNRRHDGIGLAWCLKASKTPVNKRESGGIEIGIDELEWVDKHKELLRTAIKERRNGDLRREWPEE